MKSKQKKVYIHEMILNNYLARFGPSFSEWSPKKKEALTFSEDDAKKYCAHLWDTNFCHLEEIK
jgi:hypothetical protein